MNINESLLTALDSILSNKLRSVLTMLGVIIGVASVIALLAIGNGFTEDITSQINDIGTNLIAISTDGDNSGGYPALSLDDVEALSDPLNAPDLAEVAASVQGNQTVVYSGESTNTTVTGITANYMLVNNLDEFQLGDGLTENDLDTQARVAVLGSEVAADLFGTEFPIGRSIRINGVSYEVVGVLSESGGGHWRQYRRRDIYPPDNRPKPSLYQPYPHRQKSSFRYYRTSSQQRTSRVSHQPNHPDPT